VGVAPTEFADHRLRVRIEQQLVVVEAVAARRVVWPVAAVSIKLPRSDIGKIAVPDLVGVLGQRDPRVFTARHRVEQAELDPFGMRREDGEVDPLAVPSCAARIGKPGPDTQFIAHHPRIRVAATLDA
jgi:hypothetical protein